MCFIFLNCFTIYYYVLSLFTFCINILHFFNSLQLSYLKKKKITEGWYDVEGVVITGCNPKDCGVKSRTQRPMTSSVFAKKIKKLKN